ncbi:MAG: carboxypeptidase M32 [Halobellus sp.]|uniref:carboxypeptidase M32 n=1 Tax=Halobellus sp. TaxID=1979212 RepID=UPI0035D42EDD
MTDQPANQPPESADDNYDRLLEQWKRLAYLKDIEEVLSWDAFTAVPDGGASARSKQQGALSTVIHRQRADSALGDLLEAVDSATLTDQQRANVREIRREYEREAAVPPALSQQLSETITEATDAWQQAKADNEFDYFEDYLDRIIELKREEAAAIDPDADPYGVLFAEYAPYTDVETVERIFDRLQRELVPLVEDIRQSDTELTTDAFAGTFDIDAQAAACRDILDEFGYDWDRGHVDIVPNGITLGNQFDCRIGLQMNEDDFHLMPSVAVHEFGHALYKQQLPQEHYGTPLGSIQGYFVHESQSTLWECHVGRSEEFWEYIRPTVVEHLPAIEGSARDLYESFVHVRPDEPNLLRADELTWQLHILVRCKIERALVAGDIQAADVPEVWRDTYEEYLGFRPESDAEGPLLTIHWANGWVGYFPTYTLGHVLATQLAAAAREDIDGFDEKLRRGEFGPLREWLRAEIHQHGQRYTTPELIRRVTGEELTADYYLEYVTEKFTDLYDL